jgi:hypothetical protein
MSYNFVTVTGQYAAFGINANVGRVEWYPSDTVQDTSTTEDVTPVYQTINLDATGSFSVVLLATDNANLTSFGWTFVPYIPGQDYKPVTYLVPFANGATQKRYNLVVMNDPPVN